MSQTAAETARNVRLMIDDLDKDDYAISSVRMAAIISGNVQALAARVLMPAQSGLVTTVPTVAGTFDYTIATVSTNDIGALRQILLRSDGRELVRIPMDDLNAEYRQDTSMAASSGTPRYYAIYETAAQLCRIRVAPTPNAADILEIYKDTRPTATAGDTAAIPFGILMCQAVETASAAECVLSMTPDEREKRKINKDVVQLWLKGVDEAVRAENWSQRTKGRTQRAILRVEA